VSKYIKIFCALHEVDGKFRLNPGVDPGGHCIFKMKEEKLYGDLYYDDFSISRTLDEAYRNYYKMKKMEEMGHITIYVHGLRPLMPVKEEKYYIYKGWLCYIESEKVYSIPIGCFNTDEHGKGECHCYFNPKDVGDTGIPLEKFDHVAITAEELNDDPEPSGCRPLVGKLPKQRVIIMNDIGI
jgi:hypothetical protein